MGPLDGLRILEFSGLGPCPLAGQLLADLGADVVVIDRPGTKTQYADINRRHKRSITINLKHSAGIELAKKLSGQFDVLIEGYRPGTMERLGMGPDILTEINPRLIYARMTGWGQTGPLALRAGHDINYLALSGALHAIGLDKEPPVPPLNLVADYGGGSMFLLLGILSALFERGISDKGQIIDAAMVDGVPAMMGLLHSWMAQQTWQQTRQSNLIDGAAPHYRCYETLDKKYVAVGALENIFLKQLLAKLAIPDSYANASDDKSLWPELTEKLTAVFKLKTRDTWAAEFDSIDACVSPVLSVTEASSHPHNKDRNTFVEIDGVLQASVAPRFSRSLAKKPITAAEPGAHTKPILEGLGLSKEEAIHRLIEDGAIATVQH